MGKKFKTDPPYEVGYGKPPICVNEAAVIAAGFQYREIRDVSCLPDCFSRPVSEYAIYLNDFMMHRVRNELLVPFITRLPGTSDAPWVEEERARLIVVETVRRIVAAEYDGLTSHPEAPDDALAVALRALGIVVVLVGDARSHRRCCLRPRAGMRPGGNS